MGQKIEKEKNVLDFRFFVGETLYSEHSLNPCDFFSDWVSFSLVIMFSKDKFDACLRTPKAQQFIVDLFVQNGV